MTNKIILTQNQTNALALETAYQIITAVNKSPTEIIKIFGVPRGGVSAAYLIAAMTDGSIRVTDNIDEADAIVDDLIDSGATHIKWKLSCSKPFFTLINKQENRLFKDKWVVFPWEGANESSIGDNITRLIQYCGDDPTREGLLETPKRVAKAWSHWTSGYTVDIKSLMKVFEDGAENYDEMVMVKDIPIYSKCEHHLADIFGTVTIGYIPDGKVVGLSKLSRLADAFARRLQVQERLTTQIANALEEHLQPKGVGVIIRARHMCMESRGLCQQGHHTVTSALRGVLKLDRAARDEFMMLAK